MGHSQRGLIYLKMLFSGRVCLHKSGVLFFFWRLAEKQPRLREASDRSRYPGLVLCGWWVMEEGGCVLRERYVK